MLFVIGVTNNRYKEAERTLAETVAMRSWNTALVHQFCADMEMPQYKMKVQGASRVLQAIAPVDTIAVQLGEDWKWTEPMMTLPGISSFMVFPCQTPDGVNRYSIVYCSLSIHSVETKDDSQIINLRFASFITKGTKVQMFIGEFCPRICVVCGKDSRRKCERCRVNHVHTYYCSKACQRKHYPQHREWCELRKVQQRMGTDSDVVILEVPPSMQDDPRPFQAMLEETQEQRDERLRAFIDEPAPARSDKKKGKKANKRH
jgi:hypothetical protein